MKLKQFQFLDELGKLLDKYSIDVIASSDHGSQPVDFISNGITLRIAGFLDGKFQDVMILRKSYAPEQEESGND